MRVVQRKVTPTAVYNLTLADHNAYYANGILAFNCADALCLTFHDAGQHKGGKSFEPTYFADS